MTDYLEEWEEPAEALEENWERLEAALARLGMASREEGEKPGGESVIPCALVQQQVDWHTPANQAEQKKEGAEQAEETPSPEMEGMPALWKQTLALESTLAGLGVWTEANSDSGFYQALTYSRAEESSDGRLQWGEAGTDGPEFKRAEIWSGSGWTDRARDGRTEDWRIGSGRENRRGNLGENRPSRGAGMDGKRPGGIASDEEIAQAQRMDRIFRRDSRRYDGGFFLY